MAILKDIFAGIYTTMKGMMVTGKEFFKKPITLQYPYKKREMPERFRGTLVNDIDTCNACMRCERICPVNCIVVEAEGKGKDRKPSKFTIDYVKCCWCNLCVEVCPDSSLFMTHEYETVFRDRDNMIRDFVQNPIKSRSKKFPDKDPKETESPNDSSQGKQEDKADSGLSAA